MRSISTKQLSLGTFQNDWAISAGLALRKGHTVTIKDFEETSINLTLVRSLCETMNATASMNDGLVVLQPHKPSSKSISP